MTTFDLVHDIDWLGLALLVAFAATALGFYLNETWPPRDLWLPCLIWFVFGLAVAR